MERKQVKKRKQNKKKKMNNKGFTLIELLAVITIMGILMMVAIPAVSRTIENSRRDSFATVAQNYINSVRNSVLGDEIECKSSVSTDFKTVSSTPEGTYYLALDTGYTAEGEDGYDATVITQTGDLMESGGKSPWGNADVKGYVVWTKKENASAGGSQHTTKTTYYITLVDKSKHGIPSWETDQSVGRSSVVTTGASAPASFDSLGDKANGSVHQCKFK